MKGKKLVDFFENNGFSVHLFKQDKLQGGEVENWTSGGVNMIMVLHPFTSESFAEYVENFNVDEEIELHRQDKRYCDAFTIRESLNDFEEYHQKLKDLLTQLNK